MDRQPKIRHEAPSCALQQQGNNSPVELAASYPRRGEATRVEGSHQLACVAALMDAELPGLLPGVRLAGPPLESWASMQASYTASCGGGRDAAVKAGARLALFYE